MYICTSRYSRPTLLLLLLLGIVSGHQLPNYHPTREYSYWWHSHWHWHGHMPPVSSRLSASFRCHGLNRAVSVIHSECLETRECRAANHSALRVAIPSPQSPPFRIRTILVVGCRSSLLPTQKLTDGWIPGSLPMGPSIHVPHGPHVPQLVYLM